MKEDFVLRINVEGLELSSAELEHLIHVAIAMKVDRVIDYPKEDIDITPLWRYKLRGVAGSYVYHIPPAEKVVFSSPSEE